MQAKELQIKLQTMPISRHSSKYRWLVMLLLFQAAILCILSLALSHRYSTSRRQIRHLEDVIGLQRGKHKPSHTWHALDLDVHVLLENRELCQDVEMVDVLFVVHTSPHHVAQREAIRSTFANSDLYQKHIVRVIFLLGLSTFNAAIENEHTKYGDVVLGNFTDTYKNLTYKGIMGVKWISENCRNVKYVFKIDDDTYVDTFNFFSTFYYQDEIEVIMCRRLYRYSLRVEREGRWRLSRNLMRYYTRYPWISCSGYGVVLSGTLIPKMYKASMMLPYIWIDDVFLFGILPSVLGYVDRINLKNQVLSTLNRTQLIDCFNHTDCPMVIGQASSEVIRSLWQARYQTSILGHFVPIHLQTVIS